MLHEKFELFYEKKKNIKIFLSFIKLQWAFPELNQ